MKINTNQSKILNLFAFIRVHSWFKNDKWHANMPTKIEGPYNKLK